MSIITVTGIVESNKLGIITPHEHILLDVRNQFVEFQEVSREYLSERKVGIENLDVLSRDPWALKDNLVLEDVRVAEKELIRFKESGGNTVVDVTNIGMGRDPIVLRNMSNLTGLNIIMGCGYYTYDTHPKDMNEKSVNDITSEMINDISLGVSNTGIRSGIIGEIGTSEEIHPNEKKVLIASAKAQNETGVPISVHAYPWGKRGIEALEILEKNDAKLDKVCICHVDVVIDINYCEEIIKRGAYLEFDNFGKEYCVDGVEKLFARDIERIDVIIELISSGYISKILISCDVCLKNLLHKYGGWGYDHILNNIVPIMRKKGVTEDRIDILLKENPRDFLNVG